MRRGLRVGLDLCGQTAGTVAGWGWRAMATGRLTPERREQDIRSHRAAGTRQPAGGRSFRPDIEGLRAVAVALVVLFHAGVPALAGGYIGVDVFFVLSGFLITDRLIRERVSRGSTSIPDFYARRARRILPIASLVLIVTVVASYHWLGFLRAGVIAREGQWTAVFAANLHFAQQGSQYLNSFAPPSPLQHFWSLAVEEQFYLAWPMLFVLVATVAHTVRFRVKLAAALAAIVLASFAWSVIQTRSNGTWAFYSPLTRAWELALGALLAVGVPALGRVRARFGIWLSWAGLAGVIASAFLINGTTAFPGYAAALPVGATTLVVAAGSIAPGRGAEILLGRAPFQWLGKLSYSLYLWHWPLLVIAAQHSATRLSPGATAAWVVLALVLSFVAYHLIENPIRYARVVTKRPVNSLALGLCLVLLAYGLCRWEVSTHQAQHRRPASPSVPTPALGAGRSFVWACALGKG